jgi:hypothetical protein
MRCIICGVKDFTALDDDESQSYVNLTERTAATVHDDAGEHLRRATT